MNCEAGILSNVGTVYEHTFSQSGTISYFCAAHCSIGMTGVIKVAPYIGAHSSTGGSDYHAKFI